MDASWSPSPATPGLYVLTGELHLLLGGHDLRMGPGEVTEFDTKMPHWFGAGRGPTGDGPEHPEPGRRAHPRTSHCEAKEGPERTA